MKIFFYINYTCGKGLFHNQFKNPDSLVIEAVIRSINTYVLMLPHQAIECDMNIVVGQILKDHKLLINKIASYFLLVYPAQLRQHLS